MVNSSLISLVMEFADGGDLLAKIKKIKENPGYLREDEIWKIFLQILKGTSALHKLDIIHRDLKVGHPMSSVRQHIPFQRRKSQNRRSECFKNREKWLPDHPNGHPLLHKVAEQVTEAPKSIKTGLMTERATSGLSGASFTRCACCDRPSWLVISKS